MVSLRRSNGAARLRATQLFGAALSAACLICLLPAPAMAQEQPAAEKAAAASPEPVSDARPVRSAVNAAADARSVRVIEGITPVAPPLERVGPREGLPDGVMTKPEKLMKVTTETICSLIERHAEAAGMSPDFFARLIWKESRFDRGAISPVGAQGIAQFMPYTAEERGLEDPFDVAEAIRHSALYLKDLKAELGNWGLAAAAYNGGPNRVKNWLSNGGSLPLETENYVYSITARPADWFRVEGREIEGRPLDEDKSFEEACIGLPIMKTRAVFATGPSPAASAPMRPWGVQVAGHFQESVAMKMFRRMQSQYSGILGDKEPIVLRDHNGIGRKAIYAVRIGAETRAAANDLCSELRSAGGSCVVMKN